MQDDGRARELQLASRRDLRSGATLIVLLGCLTLGLFLWLETRPGILVWVGLFWGVIRIIRGFRLRREAWELEHLGFIQRERDQTAP